MDRSTKPSPSEIVDARIGNPKARERDLAAQLGITEAELVAAHCGEGVTRIEPRVADILKRLQAVGEVMALTRNESAVHEKIGVYEKVIAGDHTALVLGTQIDLRIFPRTWAHGFAVEKRDGDAVRRSLQFFDASGEAVHKVHLREGSHLPAYEALVASLTSGDQGRTLEARALEPAEPVDAHGETGPDVAALRDRWSRMTDVHQFFGMLKELKLSRRSAVRLVGDDRAWRLDGQAVSAMMHHVAEQAIPVMCFVGNRGCIQIHSGPIASVKPMGPWINVMDETFHLHLRMDRIAEVWAVRKPTQDGHVTSVEVFDAAGGMIIQFFGERHEGETERSDWRWLAEHLPRIPAAA